MIALRFTEGRSYSNRGEAYEYGPTDTRLIPFSKSFCQSLRLTTKYFRSGPNEYNLSFYMLSSKPRLFSQEKFTLSDRVASTTTRHFLVYMHLGSEVTVSACFIDSEIIISSTSFLIVKGINEYDDEFAKRDIRSVAEFSISAHCRESMRRFSYVIKDDDYYYLIFHSTSDFSVPMNLNVSMSLNLTQYDHLYNNTITSSCFLSTSNYESTCSIPVPLSTDSYALLTIHPASSDVERFDEIPLETHCVPRLWVYIVPPILLAIVLIAASCFYLSLFVFCL